MTIKNYTMTLTTVGPVHIGAGKVMNKPEYIYDPYKALIHIVNPSKLTRYLSKQKKLALFIQYLEEKGKNADLKQFLDRQGIRQDQWKEFTTNIERVNQAKGLTGNVSNHQTFSRRTSGSYPLNDLHLFVRDGQNMPYVPGSSLKGALRTMILQDIKEDTKSNDFFKSLKVSDSLPIDLKKMVIYQKVDINKASKPMPLYRECIDVNTKIQFQLTLDDEIISIEELKKRITKFYINYWNKWIVGFASTIGGKEFIKNGGIPAVMNAKHKPLVVFLGGGAGFASKTLQYQMFPKEKAKEEIFKELKQRYRNVYGKMRSAPNNVPMALKGSVNTSKAKWYQQGACIIEFTERQ